ncbi:MAG: FGGY family carbohydrate kinase [Oscillospiraceae bacterium]|nr:FGGY family carbohydrate kinase [Oscillospiraceae bacterium]
MVKIIFLGLDAGTSSCKCSAFSAKGELIAEKSIEYAKMPGQTGLNADRLFSDVCEVVGGCAKIAADKYGKGEISSLTVSSFGESFAAVDKSGKPISDIILYTDTNVDDEVDILTKKVPNIGRISGAKPNSFYALPKMMHMLKTRPEIEKNVWKFLQVADFLIYKLCGETVIDYSLACRALAFDVTKSCWSKEILSAAEIAEEKLSSPVYAGTVAGTLKKDFAAKLNLPENTKIITGVHDQVASAAGAGAVNDGEAVVGTGSVECITPVFGAPILNPDFIGRNFACIPHAAPGKYVTYAFTLTGGSLLSWYRDRIVSHLIPKAKQNGCSVYDLLNESCAREPSDLLIVPHFGGTGTPELNPFALGTATGFSMSTGLPEIYRAILEGLCFELRYNREELALCGISFSGLRASGGGAKSDIWLKLKADILGISVSPLVNTDAGNAGGAMLAAVAMGEFGSLGQAAEMFAKTREPFLPDSKYTRYYSDKYEKYKKIRQTILNM